MRSSFAKIFVPSIFLFTSLWFLEATDLDLWIQRLFFEADTNSWLVDKSAALPKLIFYDGIKSVLYVFAAGIFLYQFYLSRAGARIAYIRGLRIVLLSLVLVPATVGILKNVTNIACPADLTYFGGNAAYLSYFGEQALRSPAEGKQRCFPAGHASGGFALMALYYLGLKSPGRSKAGLVFGVCLGWVMGGYKMLIGDHFFSHTLTTMVLSWIVIQLIVIVYERAGTLK